MARAKGISECEWLMESCCCGAQKLGAIARHEGLSWAPSSSRGSRHQIDRRPLRPPFRCSRSYSAKLRVASLRERNLSLREGVRACYVSADWPRTG
ncbi:MAG: hypothetical protein ACLR4Z_19020 [Butyricicoccaceae bacterium]